MELAMIELKDPVKIFKVGKMMSPLNSLVMKIIIIFWLGDENVLLFHWA